MWACGVVMYSMLGGNMPFWNRRQYKMVRMIINGTYNFDTAIWDQVSDEGKDLIRGLLNINSVRRLTVDQAMEHPWFTKGPMMTLNQVEMEKSDEDEVDAPDEVEAEAEDAEEDYSAVTPAEEADSSDIRDSSSAAPTEDEYEDTPSVSQATSRRSSAAHRNYSMGEHDYDQVISVGGDAEVPRPLHPHGANSPHPSMRVIALGIRSFLRLKNVLPKPVCMATAATNPYSIRNDDDSRTRTGDSPFFRSRVISI